jgi:hypothetical protein
MKEMNYVPQFPEIYAFLLEKYSQVMLSSSRDSLLAYTALAATIRSIRALNIDGIFPKLFAKKFCIDIDAISNKVHDKLGNEKLNANQTMCQSMLLDLRKKLSEK